ncbi:hypothetical protein EYC84_007348 [Monilinia fructicola]|uniref:Uncharacterized protein n=1 Tax=Monilinia fructicola TaxID=38448 RepID=A0A5M9JKG7_MONFR|nr:hypothetical protein EYC84_007348 [Monilinia fructicola]
MEEDASLQHIKDIIVNLRARFAEQKIANRIKEDVIADLSAQLEEEKTARKVNEEVIHGLRQVIGEKAVSHSSLMMVIENQQQTIACKDVIIDHEKKVKDLARGDNIPIAKTVEAAVDNNNLEYLLTHMKELEARHAIDIGILEKQSEEAQMSLKKARSEMMKMKALYDIGLGVRIRKIVNDAPRDGSIHSDVVQELRKNGNQCAHGSAPVADAVAVLHCVDKSRVIWQKRQYLLTYGIDPSVYVALREFKFGGFQQAEWENLEFDLEITPRWAIEATEMTSIPA